MENIHVPFLNSLGRAALGQPLGAAGGQDPSPLLPHPRHSQGCLWALQPGTASLPAAGQGSASVPLSARVTNQQHSLLQHSSPVLGLRGRAGAELRAGVTNTRRNWPRAAREPHLIRQTYWRAAISDLQKQSLGCLSSLN